MITLDATTKKLQIVLGEAAATELPFVAAWVDIADPATFTPGETDGTTNDTSDVDVVAAPAASTQRQVKFLSVRNSDNITHTLTVKTDNNGTDRIHITVSLPVGYTLFYETGVGFYVTDTKGARLAKLSPNIAGYPVSVTAVSGDHTIDPDDGLLQMILVDASGAARTVTLPTAALGEGALYIIKKVDSSGNAVTVDGNGAETIDDATTYVIGSPYEAVQVTSDGTEWWAL